MTSNKEAKSEFRPDTMTFRELAEFLRLHPAMQSHSRTIYRRLRQGQFRAFKMSSGWGFSREAVEHLIKPGS